MYKLKLELDGLGERLAKLGVLGHLIKTETTPAKLAAGLERWLKA